MAAIAVPPSLSELAKAAGNPFKPAAVTPNRHVRNAHFLNFSLHPHFIRTGKSDQRAVHYVEDY